MKKRFRLLDFLPLASSGKTALPKNARLLPNFIELPKAVHHHEDNQPYNIGFIGDVIKQNGPEHFCQLAVLCFDCKDLCFSIYGEGAMQAELASVFDANVIFKGAVEMTQHWDEVDLLCVTGCHKALPIMALEALARGIPILCYDLPELSRLADITNIGYIVPNNDIHAMYRALMDWHAMDDDSKEAVADKVRKAVADCYAAGTL